MTIAVLVAGTAAAFAQSAAPGGYGDAPYDGRYVFMRLRWQSNDRGFSRRGGWSNAWNHDYPRAEQHLSQIIDELTSMDIVTDGSRILALDDP
jgi:hypothetical protein